MFKTAVLEIAKIAEEPCFANATFDLHRLDWLGCPHPKKVHDVIIQDNLLRPDQMAHGLKIIGARDMGKEAVLDEKRILDWFKEHNLGKKEYWKLPDDLVMPYLAQDCFLTRQIHEANKSKFRTMVASNHRMMNAGDLYDMERELSLVTFKMERYGIQLNIPYLKEQELVMTKELEKLAHEIQHIADYKFSVSSDVQTADVLYRKLGLPARVFTESGQPSTNDEALRKLEHPIAEPMRQHREIEQMLSMFVRPWLEVADDEGKVHAQFNSMGTRSGRYSCKNPNMQQIMKNPRIMRAIVPREGMVDGHSDASQIEMVGCAWYTRDPNLLNSVRSQLDLHTETATDIYDVPPEKVTPDQRKVGKGMNFSVIFGCGKGKLASFLSTYTGREVSHEEAMNVLRIFHAKRPMIKQFAYRVMDTIKRRADRSVTNFFGRKFVLPDGKEYIGPNRLIQSWAAYVCKFAMVKVSKQLNWKDEAINCQIHDNICWTTTPEKQEEVKHIVETAMTTWPQFDVPITVKTKVAKRSWEELLD